MNHSPFWPLVWKEYRAARAFWLSMAGLGLLAQMTAFWLTRRPADRDWWLYGLALMVSTGFAVGIGGTLFAIEHEDRTFGLLRMLPLRPGELSRREAAHRLAGHCFARRGALADGQRSGRLETPVALRCRSAVGLVGAGLRRRTGLGHPLLAGDSQSAAGDDRDAAGRLLGQRIVCHADANAQPGHDHLVRRGHSASPGGLGPGGRRRRLAAATLAGREISRQPLADPSAARHRPDRPPGEGANVAGVAPVVWHLVWQSWREGRTQVVLMLIAAVIGLGLFREIYWAMLSVATPANANTLVNQVIEFLPAALLSTLVGVLAFHADQVHSPRFLAERGVPPRLVWLSRQLAWGSWLLVWAMVIVALPGRWHRSKSPRGCLSTPGGRNVPSRIECSRPIPSNRWSSRGNIGGCCFAPMRPANSLRSPCGGPCWPWSWPPSWVHWRPRGRG